MSVGVAVWMEWELFVDGRQVELVVTVMVMVMVVLHLRRSDVGAVRCCSVSEMAKRKTCEGRDGGAFSGSRRGVAAQAEAEQAGALCTR